MASAAKKTVYKVVFVNEGKVYEIYARSVGPSALIGFVEVEGLLFGERTTVLVDPTEEKLRTEFAGVERTLGNAGFVAKAAPEIIAAKKARQEDLATTIAQLKAQIEDLA